MKDDCGRPKLANKDAKAECNYAWHERWNRDLQGDRGDLIARVGDMYKHTHRGVQAHHDIALQSNKA